MSAEFSHPFKEVKGKYAAMIRRLPYQVSAIAQEEFLGNFQRQGFREGTTSTPWKARINKKLTRAILQGKTSMLRRGFRIAPIAGVARVINAVPYAKIHNDGGIINHPGGERINHFKTYKGGRHKGKTLFAKSKNASFAQKNQSGPYRINMPKRRFMGDSRYLFRLIDAHVAKELKIILP